VPNARSHADHQREKDGTLEANEAEVRQPYVVPRHRLVFAVWLTVFALPILLLDNIPKTEARAASVTVDAAHATDTTTTAAPTTTVVETTTAPVEDVAVSPETTPVTAAPKKTTTTAAPTTTTTAPPNTEQGGASWYDYRPGECAHKTLPKGTVVTITSLENGASTTCVVTDRGPYQAGRIIDLDRATFAQLKDPASGVVQVEISW
jgi:rare lipoprotein A (peptidoglycan hydrolase)